MRALRDGWCEVNLAPLNVDEIAQLAETLEGVAGGGLACLRLLCVFRGLKERTVPKPGLQRWSAEEDTRVDQARGGVLQADASVDAARGSHSEGGGDVGWGSGRQGSMKSYCDE